MEKQVAVIVAELCVTLLGIFALVSGLDGAIFTSTILTIAGLGGYHIRQIGKQ